MNNTVLFPVTILLFLFLFNVSSTALANSAIPSNVTSAETRKPEDSDEAKEQSPWDLGGWATLNGSQAAFRNWAQGGVNNITATSTGRFTAEYRKDRYIYNNSTSLKYGRARVEGGDFLKTDDEIRIRNQVRRLLDDPRFSLIFQVNFNSQFDKGYDATNTVLRSRFMTPGYFIETIGFAFNPEQSFQFDAGLSLKQTIVLDTDLSTFYGLEPGEQLRVEGGLSLGIKAEKDIALNVNYSGQLETFTNFLKPVESTTIRFTNEIIGKINSYLSANIQLALVYDDSITKELQVKQVISVGFSYRFL